MEAVLNIAMLIGVAAISIPLAVLLQWWMVRGLLALVAWRTHRKPLRLVAQVPSAAGGLT